MSLILSIIVPLSMLILPGSIGSAPGPGPELGWQAAGAQGQAVPTTAPAAEVESFTPEGAVKGVRQVQVRFSVPMVPFGDPTRTVDPFDISCPLPGKGRWADDRNWVYDFEKDLQAGIRCTFTLKAGLKSLAGLALTGQSSFIFSTGGPAILNSEPSEGNEGIDEEQVFILELDGKAIERSILQNAWLKVEGIEERIGVRLIDGDERKALIDSQYRYREDRAQMNLVVIQARRRFPNSARVDLVWGRGIQSETGVATEEDQVLPFKTRPPFTARFVCTRENPEADCIPLTGMVVYFSAQVPWSKVRQASLTGPGGQKWSPVLDESEDEQAEKERVVYQVGFKPPFPPNAEFRIDLPPGVEDDAGRKLTNASSFPLTVRTGDYPPLAKFSGNFGIIEWKAEPLLPVTLRDLEPEVEAHRVTVAPAQAAVAPPDRPARNIPGNVLRIPSDQASQILFWLRRINARGWDDREKSIFDSVSGVNPAPFRIPKPNGGKAFEVVGIPLPDPGFYVVELQSEILGASLLGKQAPLFVPTTALVTNLSVHFKWGVQSSLVWVTSLDQAKPVAGASIEIVDCSGAVIWKGTTDQRGIARVEKLPPATKSRNCSQELGYGELSRGLMVAARSGTDMAFVHTSWDTGIEPWRFNVPTEYDASLMTPHSILDRSLLRAGETLHMKHLLRKHVTGGFALVPDAESPTSVVIRHGGSEQEYVFPVKWDTAGIAETEWNIPTDAKLGFYQVLFRQNKAKPDDYPEQRESASFRVEEYRVPLLKASLQFPSEALVRPSKVNLDVNVQYLAGGGASDLPVRLRYRVSPGAWLQPEDFENFVFANGGVKEGVERGDEAVGEEKPVPLERLDLKLDKTGGARASLPTLPQVEVPSQLTAELDFRDPNGESQTISASAPLWPAALAVGVKAESWVLVKKELQFQVAVVDLKGKPLAGRNVKVELYSRQNYSHRKRLVGGFYAYENYSETKRIGTVCEGKTDGKGILNCIVRPTEAAELILVARAADDQGSESVANRGFWASGRNRWWFPMEDNDRMDLIAEKKRYEPGETARFQVRMPFDRATALVTVEREGIAEVFVQQLSGKSPVVQVPIKEPYGPNVYVSVLAVRGRVQDPKPTALVDLARPAYKLGLAEIQVGWKPYELKVKVAADREVYHVREKATVKISVANAAGKPLPAGSEITLAAVDEGLLELMPNASWDVLNAMMGRRSYGVSTATAQMHIVGKRHFGLKGLPTGGGGGRQATRELFDTLLIWRGRVPLDGAGNAVVEVPLNDSITSFRVVAVATAGTSMFGSGSTSIRSVQELTLFSGVAPLVRTGDRIVSTFTIRNTTDKPVEVSVTGRVQELSRPLEAKALTLAAGQSEQLTWPITVPAGVSTLRYQLEAKGGTLSDRVAVSQKVIEAVPVRPVQATIFQLDAPTRRPIEKPSAALEGRGGVNVAFRPSLLNGLDGVRRYMANYPYTCLEQKVSRAVALRDKAAWDRLMQSLPAYLDSDGLLKYFPSMAGGSDSLTAYVMAIAQEAGWPIGPPSERIREALRGFVEGRIVRYSSLPTADLALRKMAAIEALSRYEQVDPGLLGSFQIAPNLWPTSGVIDWFNVLNRMKNLPARTQKLAQAEQVLKSRLNFQGTVMTFSTEGSDRFWWLMVSTDVNAVRLVSSMIQFGKWGQDMPRIVRGALGRQHEGHWDLTTANAWGVLAMEKFSAAFEKEPLTGTSVAVLPGQTASVIWAGKPKGEQFLLTWPSATQDLTIRHNGTGKPWVTLQSLAAIPLKEPFSSGYRITRSVSPVEQKERGKFSQGDILRVRLDLEAQSDMTWVVVSDPIPAGASILGTGLGRDSALSTSGEKGEGWVWPAFEERSFEAFRAYYEFVPKGRWSVEYTIRLNSIGEFNLPPSRAEALYAPEMFGEIPNATVSVR